MHTHKILWGNSSIKIVKMKYYTEDTTLVKSVEFFGSRVFLKPTLNITLALLSMNVALISETL